MAGAPIPYYRPARWVGDHWEPIPGEPSVTQDDEGGQHSRDIRTTVGGPKSLDAFKFASNALDWKFTFNEMSKTPSWNGVELDDLVISKIRHTLEASVLLSISKGKGTSYEPFAATEIEVIRWALGLAQVEGGYHPVQQYLHARPEWDGVPRIDGLLGWVLGGTIEGDTKHQDLARIASANIVMGLVCRAMEPGCAWPLMTILWGAQGIGKSAFLELLMPDPELRYESATFPLSDEELFDFTRNAWLIEFSDPSTRRAESETAKTFISRKSYTYRHKYGHLSSRHPYNFGMVASGNPDGNTIIPPDASGYRRYLSVDCERRFSYDELKNLMDACRDQLWAEALHRYNAGERFQEIPEPLREIRDAAAGSKAGSEYLEGFTEYVSNRLDRDDTDRAGGVVFRDPDKGYSMDELVLGFLEHSEVPNTGNTVSNGQVVNFRRQNSAQLTSCLKQLGMVNRAATKKRTMRWFRG